MVIKGTVEHIIFRNEENGYCVFDMDADGQLVTAAGIVPQVYEGETLELSGEYTVNPKFGRQFAVKGVERKSAETPEALARFIGSGLFKGVGPVTAERIVEKFGMTALDVIETAPWRLAEVRGISLAKAKEISENLGSARKMQAAVTFLQGYGLSLNMCLRIYDAYGDDTETFLKENPYRLVEDVEGIGFLTADKIAGKLGINADSPFRARAAASYALEYASNQSGHTYLTDALLKEAVAALLRAELPESVLDDVLSDMRMEGSLKVFSSEDGTLCYALASCYRAENGIASRLVRLKNEFTALSVDVGGEIDEYERRNKIKLAGKQREAVSACINGGLNVITGGPGTGKTTIVKCILYILDNLREKTALCAPTGRAAKRLSLATGAQAKTVHRLLEITFSQGRRGGTFSRNEKNPLDFGTVIVDEVSMVDVFLMSALLKALRPGCRLIMVGDKDQLPSVGPGNVLADILLSGAASVTQLDTIFRQEESSLIITNSHLINGGQMPDLSKKDGDFFFSAQNTSDGIMQTVLDMYSKRIPAYLDIDPFQIQILAPMKNGLCGIDNFNLKLQALVNPPEKGKRETEFENTRFRTGDKVMQIVNNYQKEWRTDSGYGLGERGEGVFNGDIGTISAIEEGEVTVLFEDGRSARYAPGELYQLTLAYAITIHKSQGCEFDVVIIPVISGSYMILTRNLLYTAVTRAKKMVVLVGSRENISRMVHNNYTAKRYTMLPVLMTDAEKKHGLLSGE